MVREWAVFYGIVFSAILAFISAAVLCSLVCWRYFALKRKGYIASIEGAISKLDSMMNLSNDLVPHAQALSASVHENSKQSREVLTSSDLAAQNVKDIAQSVDSLSDTVSRISDQVDLSASGAQGAFDQVVESTKQVKCLNEAAERIGDVTKFIQNVAAQTHLLALNAAIEAARAGDAGKGFGVVATEVRNLADKTASATEEIAEYMNRVQSQTNEVVNSISCIREGTENVNSMILQLRGAMKQQRSATEEVSISVRDAAVLTREIAAHVEGIALSTADTVQSGRKVFEGANRILEYSDTLSLAWENVLFSVESEDHKFSGKNLKIADARA